MYRVVHKFADLLDDGYIYNLGDEYPRKGVEADKDRIGELKSDKNKIGVPLIKYERKKKD